MPMDQETLDKLLKKGAITQSTYDMGAKAQPLASPSTAETPAPAPGPVVPDPIQPVAAQAGAPESPTPAVMTMTPGAPAADPIKLASDSRPVVQVDPDPNGGLAGSFELAQKAQAQGAQAMAAEGAAEANVLGSAEAKLRRQQDAAMVAESDRQKLLEDQEKSIRLASEDAAKLGQVDPDRFWKNKSTGEKIGFSIAAFLSAFDPKGGNAAIDMIKGGIDRDIEAQKQDYERAKGNVGNQQSLYADMIRKFGDARQAENATRLATLGYTELQLKKTAALYKSPQVQAKALEGIAQIEQQKQVLLATARQAAEVQAAKTRLSGGASGAQMSTDVEKLPEKEKERFVPGAGFALDPEAAKKGREMVGNTKAVNSLIDELVALRNEKGTAFLPTATKEKMQTTASKLQLAIKEATKLGTLDKGAEKYMEKLVGDPTRIGQVVAQLDAMKSAINKENDVRMSQWVPDYKPVNYQPAK